MGDEKERLELESWLTGLGMGVCGPDVSLDIVVCILRKQSLDSQDSISWFGLQLTAGSEEYITTPEESTINLLDCLR